VYDKEATIRSDISNLVKPLPWGFEYHIYSYVHESNEFGRPKPHVLPTSTPTSPLQSCSASSSLGRFPRIVCFSSSARMEEVLPVKLTSVCLLASVCLSPFEVAWIAASPCSGTGSSPLGLAWIAESPCSGTDLSSWELALIAASTCSGTGSSPLEFAWIPESSCSGTAELLESSTATDDKLSGCLVPTPSEGIRDNTFIFTSISTHWFLIQSFDILTFCSWHT
jgi:hypothetical protein